MDFLDRMRSRAQARLRGSYLGERIGKTLCFSQHDMNAANGSGATVRADYNNALVALATLSSGATAPTTTYAYQPWADTTNALLKQRNGANTGWLVRGTLAESFVISRATNTILGVSDYARSFKATAGFTQTLTAAATLGDGWYCFYRNASTGNVIIDPNAAETIDGQAQIYLRPGESCVIVCDGANFYTIGLSRQAGAIAEGRNVAARTNSGSPLTTIDITADELTVRDANGLSIVLASVSVSPAITASGANGLDTGSEAGSTWYYGWVIAKPDGTVAGLLSTSSSAPTMPSGYTFKALVTAVYNDSGTNFVAYRQMGFDVFYESTKQVLVGGGSTVEAAVSVSVQVPPIAREIFCAGDASATSAAADAQITATFRYISGAFFAQAIAFAPAGTHSSFEGISFTIPNVSQQFYYLIAAAGAGASGSANAWVRGYRLPGGGQ